MPICRADERSPGASGVLSCPQLSISSYWQDAAITLPDSTFNAGPAAVAGVDAADVEAGWFTTVPVSSSFLPTWSRSASPFAMSAYVCGAPPALEVPASAVAPAVPGADPVSAFAGEMIASARTNFAAAESVGVAVSVAPVVPAVPAVEVPVVPVVAVASAPAGVAAFRHPVTTIFCSADVLALCCAAGVCAIAATAAPTMRELHAPVQIDLVIIPPAAAVAIFTPQRRSTPETAFRTHQGEWGTVRDAAGPFAAGHALRRGSCST